MSLTMSGSHKSRLYGSQPTYVATTASVIVLGPCNTSCHWPFTTAPMWASAKPCSHHSTLMCPHPIPVVTKKPPLWSLAYPCSNHSILLVLILSIYPCSYYNSVLVLSGSVKPKCPLLWSSAYPGHQQRS